MRDYLSEVAAEIKELAKERDQRVATHDELRRLVDRLPLLSQLPQASQTSDLRDKVKAIDEAVVAAVARLAGPAGAEDAAELGEEELEAVRRLLGLTSETRSLPWGRRQEAAARAAHKALNTFRRKPQRRLFHLIALRLAEGISGEAPPVASTVANELAVYSGQQVLGAWLVSYIRTKQPETARMVLLSSASMQSVLTALRDAGCKVRLLLLHPDEAVTGWQRRHIRASVEAMRNISFDGYDKLSISFYHSPAALRGWQIGDYVGLGWYTYRDNLTLSGDDPEQQGTYGHDNATIVASRRGGLGGKLTEWFEREFDELERRRSTGPDDTLFPNGGR